MDPVVPKILDLHVREVGTPYFDSGDNHQYFTVPSAPTKISASQRPDFLDEALQLSRELEEIGVGGVAAPEHPYAVERYEQIQSVSVRLAEAMKAWSPGEAPVPLEDNIGQPGLQLGAFAAAFRDDQILLIRREDTGLWSMPEGGVDVGATWANCALRELKEETTVGGSVVDLMALFDMRVLGDPPRPLTMATFLVEPNPDDEPRMMPETLGAGYFALDDLPEMSTHSRAYIAIDLLTDLCIDL